MTTNNGDVDENKNSDEMTGTLVSLPQTVTTATSATVTITNSTQSELVDVRPQLHHHHHQQQEQQQQQQFVTNEMQHDTHDFRDNGIFDYMTPERAIELYQRIHEQGVPELEWKYYGRRKPNELQESQGDNSKNNQCDNSNDANNDQDLQHTNQDSLLNTEFDFDESFTELHTDTSNIINDSLQLKNRPEPGSEKKTNLSDIMSDIMKETSHTEIE